MFWVGYLTGNVKQFIVGSIPAVLNPDKIYAGARQVNCICHIYKFSVTNFFADFLII
jgi:hypothetical protein